VEQVKTGNDIYLQYVRYCIFIGRFYSHTKILKG